MPRTIERSVPIKAKLIHPNPWNPYANKSDRLQDAIAESIGEFDQIQDLVVRPHPDTKNNKGQYQILDGEGRHRTFHGDAEIFCTVVHGLTDAQAKKITIVMDETRASADQKELNALLAELSEDFSLDELMQGLPYEEDYLAELISMGDGDFSVFDGEGEDEDGEKPSEGEWENAAGKLPSGDREPFQGMTFTLHDDQADVVREALKRAIAAGDFFEVNQNSNGNALHRVCMEYLKNANG